MFETVLCLQLYLSPPAAGANRDYITVSEILTFRPGGVAVMCVDVTINDDMVDEDDEFFTLIITVGGQQQASAPITIIDNGIILKASLSL